MGKKLSGNPRGRPKAFSEKEALCAATRVFADKGYEMASLSDLTKAMGINPPSMYATFGNKETLFRKAMDYYIEASCKHLEECMALGTAKQTVEKLLHDKVLMFTDPEGLGVCFITQNPLTGPDTTKETQRFFALKRSTLARILKSRFDRAKEEGELPDSVSTQDLAQYFSVWVQGLALQAQHGGTREQLLRIAEVAMGQWPKKTST